MRLSCWYKAISTNSSVRFQRWLARLHVLTNHGKYITNGIAEVHQQEKFAWKFRYDRCFFGFNLGTGRFIDYIAPLWIAADLIQSDYVEKALTRVIEPQLLQPSIG